MRITSAAVDVADDLWHYGAVGRRHRRNGGVVIGKSENIDIPIKKVWENPRIPHPDEVKVNLKNAIPSSIRSP